mmetsp:Transcript_43724/g.79801  ORF Transcript_43724/g.79801 Transcript_43724/m.79801 type:complete len:949 (+) Transcript_43724:85-2931(+)
MAVEDVVPDSLRHGELKVDSALNGLEPGFQEKLDDPYFKAIAGLGYDRFPRNHDARFPSDRSAIEHEMMPFQQPLSGHSEVDHGTEEVNASRGTSPYRSRRPATVYTEDADHSELSALGKVGASPYMPRGASSRDFGRGVSPLRGASPARQEDRHGELRGDVGGYALDKEASKRDVEGREAAFEVNDKVSYWSDTHSQYMSATVVKKNFDGKGNIVSYDLDVKRNALASKMKKASLQEGTSLKPEDAGGSGGGGHKREVPAPVSLASASGVKAAGHGLSGAEAADEAAPENTPGFADGRPPESTPERFEKGDKVEYWSDTYKQWMPAVVHRVRDDGVTYDLDVKRGAQFRKIRASPVGAHHGKAAEDVMPAQTVKPSAAAAVPPQQPRDVAPAPKPALTPSAHDVELMVPQTSMPQAVQQTAEPSPPSPRVGNVHQGSSASSTRCNGAIPSSGSQVGGVNHGIPSHPPLGPAGGQSSAPVSASGMSKATPPIPPPLAVGMKVKLDGLKASAQHNGMIGVLHSMDEASGRWNVQLLDGEIKSVKVSNLIVQDPTPQPADAAHVIVAAPAPVIASPQPLGVTGGSAPAAPSAPLPAAVQVAQPAVGIQHYGQPAAVATPAPPTPAPPPVTQAATQLPVTSRQPAPALSATPGAWVVQQQPSSQPAAVGVSPTPAVQVGMVSPQAATTPKAFTPAVQVAAPVQGGMPSRPAQLEVDDLQMGAAAFDPKTPQLHAQLTAKLRVSKNSSIEELKGFKGGLNQGVWILTDPSSSVPDHVLKLVRCHRIAPTVKTEAENFQEIAKTHPSIMHDPAVAMPVKIFGCFGADGQKKHDLIVMHKAPGLRFAEIIAQKYYSKQLPQLMLLFERLGACLREYHNHYSNSQHGDFQPSNVFCEEESGRVCLIDCGGMGVPTMETDVEHFQKSMRLLSDAYGHNLLHDGIRHFEAGYQGRGR